MYHISIQRIEKKFPTPNNSQLKQWVKKTLTNQEIESGEMTLRIVDIEEITQLNSNYRHKNKPTNVLSFQFEAPTEINFSENILGDIVLCPEVINEEAKEQHKSLESHWAHMVIHGTLHLLGYDHEEDNAAIEMENLEVEILKNFAIANPYSGEVDGQGQ